MLATNTINIEFDAETIHPCFSTNAENNNMFMPDVINDQSLFWTIWVMPEANL